MLLSFQVSNHRSFLDRVEFSMVAVDTDRPAVREFELLTEQVLTVGGIYGPNASGKSNLLHAITWLSTAVGRSLRGWDEYVPRAPHIFRDGPTRPSAFDVSLVADGVEYEYRLEVDDTKVRYESLFSYPQRRRRTLFEREDDDIRFRRGLSGAGAVRELMSPTTLALSAATRFRMPNVEKAGRIISGMIPMGVWRMRPYLRGGSSLGLFANRGKPGGASTDQDRLVALGMLQWADPTIVDVEFTEVTEGERPPDASRRELRFKRHIGEEEYGIPFREESAGAQAWFRTLAPMLQALKGGRVLLFDEIDASLHPKLSRQLIEVFEDPLTNPHNAQLIFTTHDPSLLEVLNRDEVWFTEKGTDGVSSLTALAEFGTERVRRSVNLEKAYLQGRFGGIPEADQAALRNTIGLSVRGF